MSISSRCVQLQE